MKCYVLHFAKELKLGEGKRLAQGHTWVSSPEARDHSSRLCRFSMWNDSHVLEPVPWSCPLFWPPNWISVLAHSFNPFSQRKHSCTQQERAEVWWRGIYLHKEGLGETSDILTEPWRVPGILKVGKRIQRWATQGEGTAPAETWSCDQSWTQVTLLSGNSSPDS